MIASVLRARHRAPCPARHCLAQGEGSGPGHPRGALPGLWVATAVGRELEHALDPTEFHNLTKLALAYAIGLPGKAVDAKPPRDPLVFATTHGYEPWDPRIPEAIRMNARSAALNAAKDEELKMLAREAGEKPVIIDAKADSEEPTETLESVNPDDPRAFGGR